MYYPEHISSITGSQERIWSVAWTHSQSNILLASCGQDRTIRLWACAPDGSWDSCYTLPSSHKKSIRYITWSPCDNYLASASFDGTIIIWKLWTTDNSLELEALSTLEGHISEVKCVAWSPSGHLLASCGRDKSVWFWEFDDEEDVQCVSVLQPHSQDVKSVAWHPFEEILVSTSYDNTINIYKEELDDWVVTVQLTGHSSTVWKAEFSPNGDLLASCSDDRCVKLWAVAAGTDKFKGSNWFCLATLSGYHTDTVFDLSWSPYSPMLLATCGADNRLCVFRLPDSFQSGGGGGGDRPELTGLIEHWAHRPEAHDGDVNTVRWLPSEFDRNRLSSSSKDSHTLLLLCTGGDDGLIKIWSIPSVTTG